MTSPANLDLHDRISGGLGRAIEKNLSAEERVIVQLKGAFSEVLLCTDRRVLIIKSGLMTDNLFGSNVYQLSYATITSAEVKFGMMSGYFELSAGGMQNTQKSYWSTGTDQSAIKAPNCVSLTSRDQAARFRRACTFIMSRVDQVRGVQPKPASDDLLSRLERLSALRAQGVLTEDEFVLQKARILQG